GLTRGILFLHSAGALPEANDISFSVLEVSCEAHVCYWLFLLDCLAAQFLYVFQCGLNVRDIYRDDGVLDFVVAFCQSAVDGSWLCGHPGLRVNLCGSDHVVFHSGVLANVPSEGFLVEALCAFLVVGRYLKVHDSCVMHILHLSGNALKWANKYSLYFTSLDQAFPFRSQNS